MINWHNVNEAKKFCILVHKGQVRKYTGEPYSNHPIAVCEIVKSVPHTENMLIAALLHDTVEDTETSHKDIASCFGSRVARIVWELTDKSRPENGNRKIRKKIDREFYEFSSTAAKTVKLADMIHNSYSIVKYDANFARVYMKEKELMLEYLREGDQTLWDKAMSLIIKYQENLIQQVLRPGYKTHK